MLIRACLTHAIVVQPFRCGSAPAVLAGLKRGEPRFASTFDERRNRREHRVLRQTTPFHHANSSGPRGKFERCLPDSGEFGDDDAVMREQRDDLHRVASAELDGAIGAGLLIDWGGKLRAKEGDQLFEAFGHVHHRYFNSTATAFMPSIYLNRSLAHRPFAPLSPRFGNAVVAANVHDYQS